VAAALSLFLSLHRQPHARSSLQDPLRWTRRASETFAVHPSLHQNSTAALLRPFPAPDHPKPNNHSDKELAKFEAFLNKEECLEIGAIVRPRARLAYPMDRHKSWEGIYVLYTYAARRPTAKAVQLLLSNPEAGSEDKLMRHITFCKY
jgi:small subunit ribosomal protein S6